MEASSKNLSLQEIVSIAASSRASDIHITTGTHPAIRIDGKITFLMDFPIISKEDSQNLAYGVMQERHRKTLEERGYVDFSFGIKGIGRFRANVFYQRNSVAMVLRILPSEPKDVKELGLPEKILDLCNKSMGIVLVTGPTGSGKSTTLAAMIKYISDTRENHIITIEDPIEYIFKHSKSIVNQREMGSDTQSFADALRAALREDPDVILVGEMRDRETIETALRAAETGHLVLGTLHTNTAISTINRIVDVFPPEQQDQIRVQLSLSLQGILSQRLVPKKTGGRVLAFELLVPNNAIRNLIKENKLPQVYSLMQSGQAQTGMQTMNQHLARLYRAGFISIENAVLLSPDPPELERLLNMKLNLE